jgi:hypothetical protein
VSTDSNLNPAVTEAPVAPVIENEIPAYRAVSAQAVLALILGLISVLCFASLYFLAVAALAVVVGFLADRKIQRLSDILTGRGLAQAGVGLGLIFGLTSVSIELAQSALRARDASRFARVFEDVLQKDSFEQAVWWSMAPQVRATTTPQKMIEEMTTGPQAAQTFEQRYASLREMKKQLATDGATVHFRRLDTHGVDGLNPYAAALYEVHVPKAEKPEQREQFALAFIKSAKDAKGRYGWWVETINFPVAAGADFQLPAKPVDDGHGHAH